METWFKKKKKETKSKRQVEESCGKASTNPSNLLSSHTLCYGFDLNITGKTSYISTHVLTVFSSMPVEEAFLHLLKASPSTWVPDGTPPPHSFSKLHFFCPLLSLLPHQPQTLLSRSIPINTQTCSSIFHHTKTKQNEKTYQQPTNQKSLQPLPRFSCLLCGKTSQKSNSNLLSNETTCQPAFFSNCSAAFAFFWNSAFSWLL